MSSASDPDLIVYGGTFDPPHNGHLLCLELTRARFPHAKVLICPTYAPLQDATTTRKRTMLDFSARMHLARAVFTGKDVIISDLEAQLPCPSLTVNTLAVVHKKYEHRRLALLLGQDQLSTLHEWQEIKTITATSDIIVARREGSVPIAKSLAQLAQSLSAEFTWDSACACYNAEKFSIYRLAEKSLNISSTVLRARQRRGQALQDVPDAVADFFAKV